MAYEARLMLMRLGTGFEWCVVNPNNPDFKIRCQDEAIARATVQMLNDEDDEVDHAE